MSSTCTTSVIDVSPELLDTPYGRANWVPLTTFLDAFLPPMPPSIDFDKLMWKVKRIRAPSNQIITRTGRLWGYSHKKPSDFARGDAYKYLYSCVERLARVAIKSRPNYQLVHNDENAWRLNERSLDSLPDAYICRGDVDVSAAWESIVVSGAYGLRDEDVWQNVKKVTRAMANSMLENPRRRFTYGFTVECSTMRLWYCDRANIVVSQAFNFISDVRTLLSFLVRCLYAEEHDLGFDTTMLALGKSSDGIPQYDITVPLEDGTCEVYRTKSVLSDRGGVYLHGRGTRVWAAMRMQDGRETGELVALKDSWIDELLEREGSLNMRIRASGSTREERDALDHALVRVITYGDVFIAGRQDCTRAVEIGGSRAELQVHARIVYADVGRPTHHIVSLSTYFSCLAKAVEDLRVLHKARWVHCDVSPGNIIRMKDGARLADVEYARHESNTEPHDATGTRDYRAAEIELGSYWFFDDNNDANLDLPKLRYNPLHDLESIWWNAAHFIIARAVTPGDTDQWSEEDRVYYQKHARLAKEVFHSEKRTKMMTAPNFLLMRLSMLHPALREVGEKLQESRRGLVRAYRKAEKVVRTMDFHSADGVHEMLHDCFASIAEKFAEDDLCMEPIVFDS